MLPVKKPATIIEVPAELLQQIKKLVAGGEMILAQISKILSTLGELRSAREEAIDHLTSVLEQWTALEAKARACRRVRQQAQQQEKATYEEVLHFARHPDATIKDGNKWDVSGVLKDKVKYDCLCEYVERAYRMRDSVKARLDEEALNEEYMNEDDMNEVGVLTFGPGVPTNPSWPTGTEVARPLPSRIPEAKRYHGRPGGPRGGLRPPRPGH
ncbi:hypothetical protein TSAR_005686 [Trichomalopsis sarcophagae]|uniref:Uncharacterized protein n=1 Tax=Trichomalopsis sarcophagae TaxID=543379 RepID=A0A232FI89_9HYME|nr:hypothetical protein TSAR_005686 [Trichomalopsis sarcophagae]